MLILFERCMKDGELVERGGHEELLNRDGEYARLHKLQAEAFNQVQSIDIPGRLHELPS